MKRDRVTRLIDAQNGTVTRGPWVAVTLRAEDEARRAERLRREREAKEAGNG